MQCSFPKEFSAFLDIFEEFLEAFGATDRAKGGPALWTAMDPPATEGWRGENCTMTVCAIDFDFSCNFFASELEARQDKKTVQCEALQTVE